MDVTTLNYDAASKLIPQVNAENEAFANGDHWQGGSGWSGPLLNSDDPLSSDARAYTERIFVVEDVLNEVLERHVHGVTGRAFVWYVTAKDETTQPDEALLAEVQTLLQTWLESRNGKAVMAEAVYNVLWAERGPLRLYVPSGVRDEGGNVPTGTMAESLARIFVEAPSPKVATLAEDPESKKPVGIYTYRDGETDAAELVYLDESNMTVIRTTAGEELPFDFGGRLTLFELRRPSLITVAQKSKQKFLNHVLTAAQASMSVAGWPEDFFFNALMPGKYEEVDGEKVWKSEPFRRGPGTANFLVGVSLNKENGETAVATPSHVRQQPVNPDSFIKLQESIRAAMLNRAHQGHVLITGMATASAEKLVKAKGEYEASLSITKEQVDRALTWLLETALAMAATFSHESRFLNLRVVADTQLDVGVIGFEERTAVSQLKKDGFISHKTALAWAGVDDVEGELALLEQENASAMDAPKVEAVS